MKYTVVIHGGAGTILKNDMTPELEKAYLQGLRESLDRGFGILQSGGSSMAAVLAAVTVLEDNILFNAGKGSVFTRRGFHEMDAAVMDGRTLAAGAVAGVKNIRNPVLLAAKVITHSNHVFLSGEGANEFALSQGMAMDPDEYFFSQFRYDQWKGMRDSENYSLDHSNDHLERLMRDKKFGTVGAVACDAEGNVAAATSTGGMTNKRFGRIGDTPVIGAGTYANNQTCAVSCTGHGEPFLRGVVAYDVSCLVEYKGLSLQHACEEVVLRRLPTLDGEGGLVAVNSDGISAMVFNTPGMYRGCRSSDGTDYLGIYS